MNWTPEKVESRFHGTREELLKALNNCDELETELFFSGFLCENPIVELAADGQMDIKNFSVVEKVQVFIRRGLVLCYLTNHEPGLVIRPYWRDKKNN